MNARRFLLVAVGLLIVGAFVYSSEISDPLQAWWSMAGGLGPDGMPTTPWAAPPAGTFDPNLDRSPDGSDPHRDTYNLWMTRGLAAEADRSPVDAIVPRTEVLRIFENYGCFTDHKVTATAGLAEQSNQSSPLGNARNAPIPQSPPSVGSFAQHVLCTYRMGIYGWLVRESLCVDVRHGAPIDLGSWTLSPFSRTGNHWAMRGPSVMLPQLRADATSARNALLEVFARERTDDDQENKNRNHPLTDDEVGAWIRVRGPDAVAAALDGTRSDVTKATLPSLVLAPNEEAFWCVHGFADMPAQVITQLFTCLAHYYGAGHMARGVTLILPTCPAEALASRDIAGNSGTPAVRASQRHGKRPAIQPQSPGRTMAANETACHRMRQTFVDIIADYVRRYGGRGRGTPTPRVRFLDPLAVLVGRVHFSPMTYWEGASPCSLYLQDRWFVPAVRHRMGLLHGPLIRRSGRPDFPWLAALNAEPLPLWPWRRIAIMKSKGGRYTNRFFDTEDPPTFRALLQSEGYVLVPDTAPFDVRAWLVSHAEVVITTSGATYSAITRMYARLGRGPLMPLPLTTPADTPSGLPYPAFLGRGERARGMAPSPLRVIVLFHKGYDHEWTYLLKQPIYHRSRGFWQDGLEVSVSNGTTLNTDHVWEKSVRVNSHRLDKITANHIRFPPEEQHL